MAPLTRYWIELDWPSHPPRTIGVQEPVGFGVTAFDLDDALSLIRREFFDRMARAGIPKAEPPVRRVTEDVDVSTLDANHVLPNMHPPNWRGVWYPRLGSLS